MKRSVIGQLKTVGNGWQSGAGIGRDCAVFTFFQPGFAVCMCEGSVALDRPGDGMAPEFEIRRPLGRLIQKCVNNLAVSGAEPEAVTMALMLPETWDEPRLKALMKDARETCGTLSLEIAGGQTRVSPDVREPVAVMTGYGRLPGGEIPSMDRVMPGQDLLVSKWVGLEGTACLAQCAGERLRSRYPSYLVEEAAGFYRYFSVLPEARAAARAGVCAMHDASEGGIFAALWELAEGAGVGLSVDLKKLPIRQETVEICEFCHINPYQLLSGGCLVMAAWDGVSLVERLREKQIPAALVGRVTEGKDRILINGDEIQYLNRPGEDELYRFFRQGKE